MKFTVVFGLVEFVDGKALIHNVDHVEAKTQKELDSKEYMEYLDGSDYVILELFDGEIEFLGSWLQIKT